jgi:ArsR family transcriptional regulator, arsenate/arsenite/antimonite-responsive transcriptional repressor
MLNLVKILKSLSDETRLRILNMLFERECCVCEIIQVLDISQPRASHHLGALYNAGLLKMRRQGLFSLYSIDWESMDVYAGELIKAVRKGLKGNKMAEHDLIKLATVERLIPECVKSV